MGTIIFFLPLRTHRDKYSFLQGAMNIYLDSFKYKIKKDFHIQH